MGWVFLQVFLAFAVAVFIVWWTFPRDSKEWRAGDGSAKPQENTKESKGGADDGPAG